MVALVLEAARADQHGVAGAHELGVAFGQLKAKDELILGQGRDRLARQNHLTRGDRHVQSPAGARREHGPFARLLGDHAAVRAHRGEVALGDVEIGLGLRRAGSAC